VILGIIIIHIEIGVCIASYKSGAQLCKGAVANLNKHEPRIKKKPKPNRFKSCPFSYSNNKLILSY
jgi:hypothetical protein